MTVHHLLDSSDQTRVCPYCGRNADANKWVSHFDHTNVHYKNHECECGRSVSVKVDFIGTGHDSWHRNLDMVVKEVEAQSQKK